MAFKESFMTNNFDCSEDHYIRQHLRDLVGEELFKYRDELKRSTPPASPKELIQKITPPKGVRTKNTDTPPSVPHDEGYELLDCEGDEIPEGEASEDLPSDPSVEIPPCQSSCIIHPAKQKAVDFFLEYSEPPASAQSINKDTVQKPILKLPLQAAYEGNLLIRDW